MGGAPGAAFDRAMRFSVGLMGCVTLGWGLTLAAVAIAGPAPVRMWRGVTLGVLIWFACDSTISVLTGFALNAASNAVLLAAYMVLAVGSGALTPGRSVT